MTELTVDILEKNGFKPCQGDYSHSVTYVLSTDELKKIQIVYDNDMRLFELRFELFYKGRGELHPIGDLTMLCCYVENLEYALKLFDVDKKIEV